MGHLFCAGGGESITMIYKANMAFAIVMFLSAGAAVGQSKTLSISSNLNSATVYVDGEWLGVVGQAPFQIASNAESVRVTASEPGIWSVEPLLFDLTQESGSTISLEAVFPQTIRVESIPSGARVFNSRGVQLGVTPLQWTTDEPITEELTVAIGAHESITFIPGSEVWNRHLFLLKRLTPEVGVVPARVLGEKPSRRWINKVALTSAFAAGALAVHFRTKADNRFDDYNQTGNRALRGDIRRLDIQSGVALGAVQVGLGVVAIRLAF